MAAWCPEVSPGRLHHILFFFSPVQAVEEPSRRLLGCKLEWFPDFLSKISGKESLESTFPKLTHPT